MTERAGAKVGMKAAVAALVTLGVLAVPGMATAAPKLSITDEVVGEPSSSSSTEHAVFTVQLSKNAKRTVKFNYKTVDDEAVSPADYTSVQGTGKITKGSSQFAIPVEVKADDLVPRTSKRPSRRSSRSRRAPSLQTRAAWARSLTTRATGTRTGSSTKPRPLPRLCQSGNGPCATSLYDINQGQAVSGAVEVFNEHVLAVDGSRIWVAHTLRLPELPRPGLLRHRG